MPALPVAFFISDKGCQEREIALNGQTTIFQVKRPAHGNNNSVSKKVRTEDEADELKVVVEQDHNASLLENKCDECD